MHGKHAAVQAALGEVPGGEQCVNDRFARRDECDVVPFAQRDGFADFKLCLRLDAD